MLDGHTLDPGDNPWNEIAAVGELVVHARTPPALVVERAPGAEIVLTNKTLLTSETLEQLPALRLVAVLATGHNVVDGETARRLGIDVVNVPEYATGSVAQHVFALLLELTNRVGEHAAAVAGGEWESAEDFCFWHHPPLELAGRSMGIVGLGRIGRYRGIDENPVEY